MSEENVETVRQLIDGRVNLGQVWEFEAGRVARAWGYLDHKKALEAAGLSK